MIWPESLLEELIEGAGLQHMFCSLTASTTRALLCMADTEFKLWVVAEVVVECPEAEHCYLFLYG